MYKGVLRSSYTCTCTCKKSLQCILEITWIWRGVSHHTLTRLKCLLDTSPVNFSARIISTFSVCFQTHISLPHSNGVYLYSTPFSYYTFWVEEKKHRIFWHKLITLMWDFAVGDSFIPPHKMITFPDSMSTWQVI